MTAEIKEESYDNKSSFELAITGKRRRPKTAVVHAIDVKTLNTKLFLLSREHQKLHMAIHLNHHKNKSIHTQMCKCS